MNRFAFYQKQELIMVDLICTAHFNLHDLLTNGMVQQKWFSILVQPKQIIILEMGPLSFPSFYSKKHLNFQSLMR